MAVLLADRMLGVRRRSGGAVGSHGERAGYTWAALAGPWPGRAEEGPDAAIGATGGRTWVLALDPAAWPVAQGDLVAEPASGLEWLVTSADLMKHNAHPDVDYVRVEAHARTQAATRP
ncbi:hypothetical protein ACFFMN_22970 [Planobispora siamensis]|uniref:Uncharacterized protein n=1 Tax=Planobispora siamensis TaxID=936338 RepID=A0A8J3SLL7_9ACTN|nr:hypothetical protein [Planobispora siamensis]GIH95430.1 hypothetical protein Psi01_60600 [Planobispora siamensis]